MVWSGVYTAACCGPECAAWCGVVFVLLHANAVK